MIGGDKEGGYEIYVEMREERSGVERRGEQDWTVLQFIEIRRPRKI